MKRKAFLIIAFSFILMAGSFLVGCGGSGGSNGGGGGDRKTVETVKLPKASGDTVYGNSLASIDASNTDCGYVMIKYKGSAAKSKIQITDPEKIVYTYALSGNDYAAFPFSSGDGNYHVDVLEQASGNMYALIFSQDVKVSLKDQFQPFLFPNQYSWYTKDSEAIQLGRDLSGDSSDDLNFVENVYNYVIDNIEYDNDKAKNVPVDYIPDIDETLDSGKGICFDYAALMTAILRSQKIPTKLVVGYSSDVYHAWISVYLKDIGWVDDIIEFDGKNWSLMDPTLAAGNGKDEVKDYIGDGSHYIVKYSY